MKPAEFLQQHSNEIVLYDQMRTAIAKCESIDEVKEIRNKAHAIEVYAAQAQNYEAESQAIKIRLRAERRCGELLKEQPKAKGAAGNPGGQGAKIVRSDDTTAQIPTLADLGISKQQSSDWQKLAEVPEEKFEAKLNDSSVRPSTTELIEKKPPATTGPLVPADVIYIWGRIRDFEREDVFNLNPCAIFDAMTDTMQDDIVRIVPQLIPWLTELSRRHSDEGQLLCDQSVA